MFPLEEIICFRWGSKLPSREEFSGKRTGIAKLFYVVSRIEGDQPKTNIVLQDKLLSLKSGTS